MSKNRQNICSCLCGEKEENRNKPKLHESCGAPRRPVVQLSACAIIAARRGEAARGERIVAKKQVVSVYKMAAPGGEASSDVGR